MSEEAIQLAETVPHHLAQAQVQDVPLGYNRTEVGVIPADWSVAPLLNALRLPTGQVDPRHEPYRSMVLVAPDHIESGTGRLVVRQSAAEQGAISGKYLFKFGDIVYSKIRPYLRKAILADFDGLCSADMYPLAARPGISPGFMLAVLLGYRFSVFAEAVSARSGIPKINRSELAEFRVALPSPTEQRAIAEALSDADRLLVALEAMIVKKRAIKQATMQQLLTGKTRLPGFSGGREPRRLGDHVTFLRHGINSRAELTSDGAVKYLHYGDIHTTVDVHLEPSSKEMPRLPADRARTLDRLQDGDLVLVDASEDLEGVGKSVEIRGTCGEEVVSGLHTIAARFDKAVLADGFKAYLQFCPAFGDHLRRLAAGTKVYATNRAHVASVEMPLPGVEEQTAIAVVLADMDAEIDELEARREKARAIKQGMMQQLLTGWVRLVKPSPAEAST